MPRQDRTVVRIALWAFATCACSGCPQRPAAEDPLGHLGRVAVVGEASPSAAPGTSWVQLSASPKVEQALQGTDVAALHTALREQDIRALWVTPGAALSNAQAPIAQRCAARQRVPGLVAKRLTAAGSLYAPAESGLPSSRARSVVAKAARQLLAGAAPPPLTYFPAELQQVADVEVLIALREGQALRLWRSARASSIAAGLVSAATAARDRWLERQGAMGGPLAERLERLGVEVSLIVDDGTLVADRLPVFDALSTPVHGIGIAYSGRWRYLLPKATSRAGGASAAVKRLLGEQGLGVDAFTRGDVRVYRFVMVPLATSAPPALAGKAAPTSDASSPPASSD